MYRFNLRHRADSPEKSVSFSRILASRFPDRYTLTYDFACTAIQSSPSAPPLLFLPTVVCPAYPDIPVAHSRFSHPSRVPLARARMMVSAAPSPLSVPRERLEPLFQTFVRTHTEKADLHCAPRRGRAAKMEVALTPRYSRVARQRYRYIPVFCTVTTVVPLHPLRPPCRALVLPACETGTFCIWVKRNLRASGKTSVFGAGRVPSDIVVRFSGILLLFGSADGL